jgi:hypothetical protein
MSDEGCAFVTLSALEAGYGVVVVTDATGTFNTAVREAAWTRMAHAGVQLMPWSGVPCAFHRDGQHDIEGVGHLLSNHIPANRNLMTNAVAKTQSPGRRFTPMATPPTRAVAARPHPSRAGTSLEAAGAGAAMTRLSSRLSRAVLTGCRRTAAWRWTASRGRRPHPPRTR